MIALKGADVPSVLKHATAAVDAGLPLARLIAGPRERLRPLHEYPMFKSAAKEHGDFRLLHGSLIGAVTDSSA